MVFAGRAVLDMRVVAAMSGGVDSSLAAARLKALGHEVIGVTLHLWDYPDDDSASGRCCAPEDVHDARRAADFLGIPHFAFDRRKLFEREVVEPFVKSYLEGQTPSPCVRCNRGVKVSELLGLADRLGAEAVATGHYARVQVEGGRARLYRGHDRSKDQSYFLHMLPEATLARLVFPLGNSTKGEVRDEARALGLPGAEKGESQELCFVSSGRYDEFIRSRAGAKIRPGPILGSDGQEVGRHDGVFGFTVGQRRNLGVALGHPAYVVGLDADRALVKLGKKEDLLAVGAEVSEPVLCDDVALPADCEVAVRYSPKVVGCRVERVSEGGQLKVIFREPVQAVVPGQYAVFYLGDRVLGGGVVARALPLVRGNDNASEVTA